MAAWALGEIEETGLREPESGAAQVDAWAAQIAPFVMSTP